jgi:hypothetical protein
MGWAVSYTLLAKAKPIYFFLNELASTVWGLPIKLYCYSQWGLTGFGMATLIVYALYLLQVLIVTKKLFGISYEFSIWKLYLFLNIPVVITVFIKLLVPESWGYICGTLVLLIAGGYAVNKLNRMMDLKAYFGGKINKIKSKRNAE